MTNYLSNYIKTILNEKTINQNVLEIRCLLRENISYVIGISRSPVRGINLLKKTDSKGKISVEKILIR